MNWAPQFKSCGIFLDGCICAVTMKNANISSLKTNTHFLGNCV
jgi:hypothetical protein